VPQSSPQDTSFAASYYRARYYDPQAGRFASEDPKRFVADADFYRYGFNNPVDNTDPLGLAPTSWHRDVTYNLAVQAFGAKCQDKAKAVADANAETDALGGIVGGARFFTFRGPGWDNKGPHFPDQRVVVGGLMSAISRCELGDLGRGLHSLQDFYFHFGVTPRQHFVNILWDYEVLAANRIKAVPRVEAAIAETAATLQAFNSKCLTCCQ